MRFLLILALSLAGLWLAPTAEAAPITTCTAQAPWGKDGVQSFGQIQGEGTCTTQTPWFRDRDEVIIEVAAQDFSTAFTVHDRLGSYTRHIEVSCDGPGCRDGYLNRRGVYTIPCFDNCMITATGPGAGKTRIQQVILYDHFSSSFDATLNWNAPAKPAEPQSNENAAEQGQTEATN
jgi:hypothetical protein